MKINNKIIGLLLTAFIIQSCETDEFLNKTNPNTINSDTYGYTEAEATDLVVAAYSPLNHNLSYGRWQQMIDNLRSDEALAVNLNEGRGDFDSFTTLSASTQPVEFAWQSYFTGVFRANLANELITERALKGVEADKVKEELGESHFLRAYNYFWLVLNFNNVPLIKQTPKLKEDFYPSQAKPEEVWAYIIEEFTKAKELLPSSWPVNYNGRATKQAAAACLGRAYLFRYNFFKNADDLSKAKAAFEEAAGSYSLTPSFFANFSLENEFNSESIFEIPFVTYAGNTNYGINNRNVIHGEIRGQEFAPQKTGHWSSVDPERRAFNEFTDLTPTGQIDPRRDVTFHYNKPGEKIYRRTYTQLYGATSNYVGWKKYQVSMYPEIYPNERINGLFPPLNYREFRFGDMLLLMAEVENELDNLPKAIEYINRVRARAGVIPLLEVNFNQASLRDQLIHERAVELTGEGKRWFDLLRWGKLATYIKPLHPGFTTGIHEYLPIPAKELVINTNLMPNNGY